MSIKHNTDLPYERAGVPEAAGLEDRILAQTSVMSQQTGSSDLNRKTFLQRPLVSLLLAASLALFVIATVINVPETQQAVPLLAQQTSDSQVLEQVTEQAGFGDERELHELMLLHDEHFFAQLM